MKMLSPSRHYILVYRDKTGKIRARKHLKIPVTANLKQFEKELPHGFKLVSLKINRVVEPEPVKKKSQWLSWLLNIYRFFFA